MSVRQRDSSESVGGHHVISISRDYHPVVTHVSESHSLCILDDDTEDRPAVRVAFRSPTFCTKP